MTTTDRASWQMYRATVDYGDDRIRTYAVEAPSIEEAEKVAEEYARGLLSVAVLDDYDEHEDDDYDDELEAE